jgi:hypothetical protein
LQTHRNIYIYIHTHTHKDTHTHTHTHTHKYTKTNTKTNTKLKTQTHKHTHHTQTKTNGQTRKDIAPRCRSPHGLLPLCRWTAVHFAASGGQATSAASSETCVGGSGHCQVLTFLKKSGADLDEEDLDFKTPLSNPSPPSPFLHPFSCAVDRGSKTVPRRHFFPASRSSPRPRQSLTPALFLQG